MYVPLKLMYISFMILFCQKEQKWIPGYGKMVFLLALQKRSELQKENGGWTCQSSMGSEWGKQIYG